MELASLGRQLHLIRLCLFMNDKDFIQIYRVVIGVLNHAMSVKDQAIWEKNQNKLKQAWAAPAVFYIHELQEQILW